MNAVSLLDNDFDISHIDIIHNIVLNYLEKLYIYRTIDLQDGFYAFNQYNELYKTDYDNNPINWYILYKPFENEFYISKRPTHGDRIKNRFIIMRTSRCTPLILEYILEQKY